ncbi:Glu-tRNA(Gln) amidotransferase GatDE subunit E [Candidatus Woesearchaeota archaeon]|nr:Glu-tRNA(Gln) amidotransferase GatDE subunit E [Candidatus Woesearchaeota archaeon]|tara:strand:- start:54696 stop:56525 length:1830 start_codon:yes stop_codon:yes gene_type:complete
MIDYSQLGLKAGIEVHQQLDTKTKLFCKCPAKIRDDQADIVINRRLRAAAGETGEVDVAAAYEQLRSKHFIYHAYNDSVCNVELDEEPIHDLNDEALNVCLQAALMLNAKVVDKIMVMRKTVVDGSNTSGFQRTAFVAGNGNMELLSGKIGISSVCIEEDSAKIVERGNDFDTYNLSRLGIPLVEIATEPDIKNPEQLREVAEYLGMILRSTKMVKRGLGTIRQDVNVSIKDGARVEIKGAQDLRMLSKWVEFEVLRQKNLVDIAKELNKRKAEVSEKIIDVTDILKSSESKLVKNALSGKGVIKAIKLKNFKGIIGMQIQPDRRLGTELSDYAKAFGNVSGIIHSDELPRYGINEKEIEKINKKVGCSGKDAFVLVAADEEKTEIALNAVISRAKQAKTGIPKEVRKANSDGTTTFLRPMPGSARMYPETDAKSVRPVTKGIALPQLLTEKAKGYSSLGLSKDLAHKLIKEGAEQFFEQMIEQYGKVSSAYIAEVLVSYAKEMEKRKLDHTKINDDHLKTVFSALNKGTIAKESVMEVLAEVADGKSIDLEKYRTMTDEELEKELKQMISSSGNEIPLNVLIGKVMSEMRGKASGKKIVEMLKRMKKE